MKTLSRDRFREPAIVALVIVLACSSASFAWAAQSYVEDFEDDILGPTVPGFASSIFNHNLAGPNWLFLDDSNPLPIFPSPHWSMLVGAATSDLITFTLPPGKYIDYAAVWMTGTGGGYAGVTFYGQNGFTAQFGTMTQDLFQLFDTTGSGIDKVIAIQLALPATPGFGPEGLYDNVIIQVVPEPASWALAGALAVALAYAARRR
jgi:hypothetical protein